MGKIDPDVLLEFENLEHLSLNFALFSKNQGNWAKIRLPAGLEYLGLQGVPDKVLPALLAQVTGLETLNFSCSGLSSDSSLPGVLSLGKHRVLRELQWESCSFASLSVGRGELTRLESIYINSSKLERLPADFVIEAVENSRSVS